MKIRHLYKIFLTAFFSIAVMISCEYDDVNQDPTRPGGDNVPLVAIVPAMQTQTHRNIVSEVGRYAGIIMQQWQGFDAQQLEYTSYVIGESEPDAVWNFGFYTGSMRDATDIIERATATNAFNTRGVAKIYMAINLGLVTNAWGDVPYSEAFLGQENLSPKYDDQQEIYNTLQTLLSEAIDDLNAEDPVGIQGDLLNGSNEQWISAAHSLKARFYIEQTNVNPNAAQLALDELDMAVSSNIDQLNFQFENTINGGHPLALFGLQRINTIIIDDFFANLMMGDPRMDLYMTEADGGNFLYFQANNPDLFWAQLNSPSPVISYSETKFIESEALERTGRDGTDALEEAIRSNMSYLGILSPEIDTYLNTLTEINIQTIIIEKYKAMYGQVPMQVWNDYRRTGFPDIIPNPNGANPLNPSGIVPRRLLYTISQRLSNPEEYQAAIDAQGGHLLDDDIWVFPRN
jgi:hypothetical protein